MPHMGSDGSARFYSYADVATRLEQALGERPSLSTLRAAAAAARRTRPGTTAPRRLTAGMPRPLDTPPGQEARFLATAIEAWLEDHPRVRQARARELLARALAQGGSEIPAVAQARASGLSWRTIVDELSAADGRRRTIQGVTWQYRRQGIR